VACCGSSTIVYPTRGWYRWPFALILDKDFSDEEIYHSVCHCSRSVFLIRAKPRWPLAQCLRLVGHTESDTILGSIKVSESSQTEDNIEIHGVIHISDAPEYHTVHNVQY